MLDGFHYEVSGEGEPLVLIHEGIADSRMWDPQVAAFAGRHRVVRYDLRGFGRSRLEPGKVSFRGDLLALLDHLAIDRAALVGASLGGGIALEVALTAPERVRALVLVGTGLPEHEWSPEMQAREEEEETALERGDVEAAIEMNLRVWVDGPGRIPDDVDPAVRALVREMLRRMYELQLPLGDSVSVQRLDPPISARLDEIQAPTLVVLGEEDVPDIHQIGRRLAGAIQSARLATIPNAAHLPNLERPDEFNRLVLGFLDALG